MALFTPAFKKTLSSEGLYSNDAADSGGMTVYGLAINIDKDWDGWALVKECQKSTSFPKNLKEVSEKLIDLASPYYKKKYWMPMRGDEIKDQQVAESIYDIVVNSGLSQGLKFAQRSVGLPDTGKMSDELINKINNK